MTEYLDLDVELLAHALANIKIEWTGDFARLARDIAREYRRLRRKATVRLTEREQATLRLVEKRMRNREIAATLGITEQTVKNRMLEIANKVGLHKRHQIVAYARQHGLLESGEPKLDPGNLRAPSPR